VYLSFPFFFDEMSRHATEQDRQFMYNVTLRRVRATIVAVEKQYVLHNLCVCVCVCVFVALDIQHAMRMCHIVIRGLPRSTSVFHFIS